MQSTQQTQCKVVVPLGQLCNQDWVPHRADVVCESDDLLPPEIQGRYLDCKNIQTDERRLADRLK
jgi:hypothetical protein